MSSISYESVCLASFGRSLTLRERAGASNERLNRNSNNITTKSHVGDQSAYAIRAAADSSSAQETPSQELKWYRGEGFGCGPERRCLPTIARTDASEHGLACFAVYRKVLAVLLEQAVDAEAVLEEVRGTMKDSSWWIRSCKCAGSTPNLGEEENWVDCILIEV